MAQQQTEPRPNSLWTFTKMQGLGNDFVVFDATQRALRLTPNQCRQLADRRFGIGADQILLVETSALPDVDFRYRIFNADGSEVEQCGNGARCFAKFVVDQGLTDKSQIVVETLAGIITLTVLEDTQDGFRGDARQVTVNMGAPRLMPAEIPFLSDDLQSCVIGHATAWYVPYGDGALTMIPVSMGNPHAVMLVDDLSHHPVGEIGAYLEPYYVFPQKANIGFMQILDAHGIQLRVYERGAGETLACGSGACAAVVAGILTGVVTSPVTVHTRGGKLNIAWDGIRDGVAAPVMMTGSAVTVFDGSVVLSE
jgi:diaminopimelate epimerase